MKNNDIITLAFQIGNLKEIKSNDLKEKILFIYY